MGKKSDRHVVKHGGGWAVKAPGASRASVVTSTQKQAEGRAKEIYEIFFLGLSFSRLNTNASRSVAASAAASAFV